MKRRDVFPGRHAILEAADVGVDDRLVGVERKQQRDVDVDAFGGERTDGGEPGLRRPEAKAA
jgi:hypothetical protein